MKTILDRGRHRYLARATALLAVVALIGAMVGCHDRNVRDAIEIWNWHDLHAVSNNMTANHVLMTNLDRNTDGYEELAGPTANGGKGWLPIGSGQWPCVNAIFDGQGYEIRDLFIDRPDEDRVGLFKQVDWPGLVKNVGVVNATVTGGSLVGGLAGGNWGAVVNSYATGNVTGNDRVGGLVGHNWGTVSNSYATGSVTGSWRVGGLVGDNIKGGTVSDSYATGSVTGNDWVGGLVGSNGGTVSNSHATGSVTGTVSGAGGLVGSNGGTVSNSHATGSVTGEGRVGGLVGSNGGTVSNSHATGSVTGTGSWVGGLVGSLYRGTVSSSHYNYSEVLINGENVITIGALFHEDFEQWLANGRFLAVTDRLDQEGGYYLINDVSDLKQLLAFGQDGSLRFRLQDDIDLGADPGFYIPYLAGEFDGNGHRISNLSLNSDFISGVGLFGRLTGMVSDLGVENVSITGRTSVGGLVGRSSGTVSNSHATGSVTGEYDVGGLVGNNSEDGMVTNSYSAANVTGAEQVGGLVGGVWRSTVTNSYAAGTVTGNYGVGGLVGHNAAGTIRVSYSHSTVTGNDQVGGLVGGQSSVGEGGELFSPTVWGSFWDTETSGQSSSRGGQGKTTAEMQDITTFTTYGWDIVLIGDYFNETWYIDDGNDYPRLGWQYP